MPEGTFAESIPGLVTAYQSSQALYTAVHLGIPDALGDGGMDINGLAAATGTHPPSLRRLVRMLSAMSVLTFDGELVRLADGAQVLRTGVPGSERDRVLFLTGPWLWKSWGDLPNSIRSGDVAFDRLFGMGAFDYWHHDPAAGEVHDNFFTSFAGGSTAAIVSAYDWGRFSTIMDVGGNEGPLLAAILAANAGTRGVLFDLPHVVTGAPAVLEAAGVADRCELVGGSFFESVPAGSDACILKFILHDWDDERCETILRACRKALEPGPTLLVIEQVLPEEFETTPAAFNSARLDLQMLVLLGGQERTESEYRRLLARAGFDLRQAVPTRSPFTILEAVAI